MNHIKLIRRSHPIKMRTSSISTPKPIINRKPRIIIPPSPTSPPEVTADDIPLSSNPTTTILITAYNRTEQLKWGLSSLAAQKTNHKFNILVLNDGLPDDTESICESFKDRLDIKYLFTGHRNLSRSEPWWRVPGFAFNIGVKQTDSDIIFLSCAEMYLVGSDVLNKCIEQLITSPKSTVTPAGHNDAFGMNRVKTPGKLFNLLIKNKVLTQSDLTSNTCTKLNVRYPYFMGMLRHHYLTIGGYDEDFVGICADDDDLIYRLGVYGLSPNIIKSKMVHLWHTQVDMDKYRIQQNIDLYTSRMKPDNIIRNKNKSWGELNA